MSPALHGKSFVPAFCKISIDHLHVFDNLQSGQRNYSFGKILEKVLNFRSKICTNPGIFLSPTGGGTAILRGHPSQSTFISHLVEYWSSPGNGTCDLLLSGQALYQLSFSKPPRKLKKTSVFYQKSVPTSS